jgi:Arc/MetJ-type ribon-helix-helix transcriptional regulator
MADKIVSVRMPLSLVEELKVLAEENHYLDVSEEIRSLLRQEYLAHKRPAVSKVQELKKNLSGITEPDKIRALKKTLKILEEINEL